MRNPLTTRIETRIGVLIILLWVGISFTAVTRSMINFSVYLTDLNTNTPLVKTVRRTEARQISQWLILRGLNAYGDAPGTSYTGGTPLFDEETGKSIDRDTYLMRKFPGKPWINKTQNTDHKTQTPVE